IIKIDELFEQYLDVLAPHFKNTAWSAAEENIQARIRGNLLMAISNKNGYMVLTTGNKSELSVGYATLYGDMSGGFAPLKDIPKTMVYRLANYRNALETADKTIIPERVIERAPSAELAEDQKDQDSLPPYDVLDEILARYVEQDQDPQGIYAAGFDKKTVDKVIHLVNRNEYKRRQAPIGIRTTQRAFGKDRRYPITSGYHRKL
ncbi:MAG: NAD(+) synthase, partial [Coxiellaceae bacterium]|nr:NAD(+) synthase [Coxiellaceae bacterium]